MFNSVWELRLLLRRLLPTQNNGVSEKLLLVSKVNASNLCPDIPVLLIRIYRHKSLSFCYVTIASSKQRSVQI